MDEKIFISLVKKLESKTKGVSAWAVCFVDMYGRIHIGRVIAHYSERGVSTVVGWVGPNMTKIGGKSNGGGFDQILAGQVVELSGGRTLKLTWNWIRDLEGAGFAVQQIV
jgi:hypothetical protein